MFDLSPRRPALCAAPLLIGLLAAALPAQLPFQKKGSEPENRQPGQATGSDRPYEEVLEEYAELVRRPSLAKRATGRRRLAATRDPRALDVLIKSYSRPEEPKDQVRYLISTLTMDAFGAEADPEKLDAWRADQNKPRDAWMWYLTLQPFIGWDTDQLRELATGRDNIFLRQSAMAAFASTAEDDFDSPEAAQLCMDLLNAMPSKDAERALVIESCAEMLLAARQIVRSDEWKPVADKLIDQLDDPDTPERTVLTLSRYFAKTFEIPNQGFESRWWRSELDRSVRPEGAKDHKTHTVPFFSIRTMGSRFVYVIDASDSMLRKVTERSLGPITGASPKKGDGSAQPNADELDWSRISTRFDVAREYLRRSLLSLNKSEQFAVVLFGTKAELLDATPKLMPGTARNVTAAIKELDAVRVGAATANRPDGVLRGSTNVHGGMRLAFRVTDKGLEEKTVYVNKKSMLRGCDTILLLSDGRPSMDDWLAPDMRDPWDNVGDQERGVAVETDAKLLNVIGPYGGANGHMVIRDVTRMNLFRRCEIHCVGIGEADTGMLQRLAKVGLGNFQMVEER